MDSLFRFVSIFVLLFLTACSAKKTALPAPVSEDVAAVASEAPVFEPKVFFSEISVLIETKADESCKDKVLGRSLTSSSGAFVSISEDQKLKSARPVRRSAINVTVELMGLDKGRLERSIDDHGLLKENDLTLLFRRKPGLALELRYLNETLVLRGDSAPVYSFSASEDREGCKVTHHINVFQDRTGLFDRLAE